MQQTKKFLTVFLQRNTRFIEVYGLEKKYQFIYYFRPHTFFIYTSYFLESSCFPLLYKL